MTFRWGALALTSWMLLAPLQARSEAEPLIKLPSPLGAHRGGRAEFPENTAYAYREAAKRWPHILLEGDIHHSSDGVAVMMHDRDVDRTTNGSGPLRNMTLEQLQQLDAAYHFTTDDGKTFPLRGQGITVPTFAEGLKAAPNHWFLIEMKDGPNIVDATLAALRETGSEKRVIIASFNPIFMRQLREKAPEILTCYDTQGAMKMLLALRGTAWDAYVPESAMLTYSPGLEKTLALTPDELIKLQSKGIHIQMHTINDEQQMRRYLNLGVDSILTDYPTRLDAVLEERAGATR
ncbi:MAG: hypothetical protein RLZZ303_460 [Candidatus Hydrogenedentota bacterium]